jgi:thiol-disulfide isomerase/thioredoxin
VAANSGPSKKQKKAIPMHMKKTLAFCAALLLSSWSHALTTAPYSPEAFAKLQAAGEAVTLHFRADWCPTCRAQDKSLEALKADSGLNLTVLSVDYDKETTLKKELNVRSQSTFIVYRGKVETARQIGVTSPEGIRKTLGSSL